MTFYFYDLETTGFNPRKARIMQFAGQRTDMSLNPVGEPMNVLVKLTPDVLPDPSAIMVTGITPQQTIVDGITEAEFLKQFHAEAAVPDTIFVGFNSIRFDDEFMRFTNYRNFYDPYEWQWKDGRSRWDILDVARMTRALRPDGIEWPFAPDGKPANRLELLTSVNKLEHDNAHDAFSDVNATIAVAKLIKTQQPELFEYLLNMRDKKKVAELVGSGEPFVYTTGRYPSSILHTSAAILLARHTEQDSLLVYDLRYDPTPFLKMSLDELEMAWKYNPDPDAMHLPVKTIKYNRAPAVAPLGVIKNPKTQARIGLTLETITKNLELLKPVQKEFTEKLMAVIKRLNDKQKLEQATLIDNPMNVDARLYENFISNADQPVMQTIRSSKPESINDFSKKLSDERLKSLLPLYKARNYPKVLDSEERKAWDEFCRAQLFDGGDKSRLATYFQELQATAETNTDSKKTYLLEELKLYGQSLMSTDID
jgi:exodeoxyribonuclease-1